MPRQNKKNEINQTTPPSHRVYGCLLASWCKKKLTSDEYKSIIHLNLFYLWLPRSPCSINIPPLVALPRLHNTRIHATMYFLFRCSFRFSWTSSSSDPKLSRIGSKEWGLISAMIQLNWMQFRHKILHVFCWHEKMQVRSDASIFRRAFLLWK